MGTHFSILAWEIPRQRSLEGCSAWCHRELDSTEWVCSTMLLGRKAMTNLDSILKSRDVTLPTKVHSNLWFFQGHVWMWELDYKKSWALKNGCIWNVVLEKTLENLLGHKQIKLVHPKGNQSWIFIGRTHAEAETLKPWPPDKKNWLIGKHPYAGRDLKQGKKGLTEDEMVRWHHWLDGQSLGSGNWWWTGKPGVLQSMGSHRVGQDWVTELNCTLLLIGSNSYWNKLSESNHFN